jgi:DNA topoisomerase-1
MPKSTRASSDRYLVVVESESKKNALLPFLTPDYDIMVIGSPVKSVVFNPDTDSPDQFELNGGEVSSEEEPALQILREKLKTVKGACLAMSPDEAGELSALQLTEWLQSRRKVDRRWILNELTQDGINQSLDCPRKIDKHRAHTHQVRVLVDSIVAHRFRSVLKHSAGVKVPLSFSLVQSLALKRICDREYRRSVTTRSNRWDLEVELRRPGGRSFTATLMAIDGTDVCITEQSVMEAVLIDIKEQEFTVDRITSRTEQIVAPLPFNTRTLLAEAARRLDFTPAYTLELAFDLYHGFELGRKGRQGLITYPLSESFSVRETARSEARSLIMTHYGGDYLSRNPRVSTVQYGEMEAIRPVQPGRMPSTLKRYLETDTYRLYRLIWERFIAAEMKDAQCVRETVRIGAGPRRRYVLKTLFDDITFRGFMVAYDSHQTSRKQRVKLDQHNRLLCMGLNPVSRTPEAMPRYTRATLLDALCTPPIGLLSECGHVIETLMGNGLISWEAGELVPTPTGVAILDILVSRFPYAFDVTFWEEIEKKIGLIYKSDRPVRSVLRTVMQTVSGNGRSGTGRESPAEPAPTLVPDSSNATANGVVCPKCGRIMVLKDGRYGRFWACSGFPGCRATRPVGIGVHCPVDGCDGDVIEKQSKKGRTFYGCSRYPRCTFISWKKPVDIACPKCNSPYLTVAHRLSGRAVYECPSCKAEFDAVSVSKPKDVP